MERLQWLRARSWLAQGDSYSPSSPLPSIAKYIKQQQISQHLQIGISVDKFVCVLIRNLFRNSLPAVYMDIWKSVGIIVMVIACHKAVSYVPITKAKNWHIVAR